MTKKELVFELEKCNRNMDVEMAWIQANYLLVKFIGSKKVTAIWNEIRYKNDVRR